MEFFTKKPTRRTVLPTVHTFEQAQEAARAFFAHGPETPEMAADLLAPVLLCWPAATSAGLTVGDVLRLLDSTVTAEAERAQLLAVTPAGPARDALAKVEGFDRGALKIAVTMALAA